MGTVSYVIQKGGAAALTPEGQNQWQENIAYYRQNAQILAEALERAEIAYWGGRNAPYVWMKCPWGLKSWEFFDRMLEEIQVIGTPGAGFGSCGEGYFRLSAFGGREETEKAAERMAHMLR